MAGVSKLGELTESSLSVFEAMPVGVLILDSKSRIEYASQLALEIFGMSKDELVGCVISDHVSEEDRTTFKLWLHTQQSHPINITSFSVRASKPDGSMCKVKLTKHSSGVFENEQSIIVTVEPDFASQDASSKSLPETAIWGLLTDALDASPHGFNIWQAERDQGGQIKDFRCLFMNKVGAAPHTAHAEELIGVSLNSIFPQCREEGFFQALENSVENNRTIELVLEDSKNAQWPGSYANLIVPMSGDRVANSFREVTRDLEEIRSLRDQATLDPLTGLLNRKAFESLLDTELRDLETLPHPFAVCFVDIDNFKRVNDKHGHEAGDHVLRLFADRLQDSLRVGDIVGRVGGDEFVVLLSGLKNRRELESICERIQKKLSLHLIWRDAILEITASIGVAFHEGSGNVITQNILRESDQAMYRAKKNGKNQISVSLVS